MFSRFSPIISGQSDSPQLAAVSNLVKALRWPQEFTFPCIDLVRMAILNPPTADILLAKHSEELLDIILQNLSSSTKAANQMLALRSLANLFSTDKGKLIVYDEILHLDYGISKHTY